MDFSKIESGMMEIIEADYMFSSLINDVIGIIQIRLIEKPIQFVVSIEPSLFEHLEHYPYVFISSFMYGSIYLTLEKMEKPPKLILLADVTESLASKDARVLALPAHSLSIANILNDSGYGIIS